MFDIIFDTAGHGKGCKTVSSSFRYLAVYMILAMYRGDGGGAPARFRKVRVCKGWAADPYPLPFTNSCKKTYPRTYPLAFATRYDVYQIRERSKFTDGEGGLP